MNACRQPEQHPLHPCTHNIECMVDFNIFLLTAHLRFSQNEYTFAEEDGVGKVTVEGTPGLTAYVIGGGQNIL